jgi:hypothetical protein
MYLILRQQTEEHRAYRWTGVQSMEYILGLHVSVPGLYQTGLARLPPEPADDPPCSALTRTGKDFAGEKKQKNPVGR